MQTGPKTAPTGLKDPGADHQATAAPGLLLIYNQDAVEIVL